ncbi:MAG: pilus (MSHA type) biogenesis protein MshL [Candidatus Accumulibacter sp.]|nr:pilus (MSHA type) biogenesis protein MshL [Accumulibacter sp.]
MKCLAATSLLSGCSVYRSFDNLQPGETVPVTGMNEAVINESRKLQASYDELREKLERVSETVIAAQAVAPDYDPLENKLISVNMHDADIGQLLLTLANQQKLNLVIDPLVLEQKYRANLYLDNVTTREVYQHILDTFDLYGIERNGALVVNLLAEQVLNAGFLNTSLEIDLASGGDVFGSNASTGDSGSGGDNTLRADFSVKGSSPQKLDPYEQLENAVKQILGLARDGPVAPQTPGARRAVDSRQEEGPPAIPVAYSLNRTTGELYVKARPSQMRSITKLVERNKNVLRRQVQVEAQLIDIQLKDGYQFGVDWTLLRNNLAGIYGSDPLSLQAATSGFPEATLGSRSISIPAQLIGAPSGSRGLGLSWGDDRFSATIKALSSFGTLRVLSNPSVRVRNGTPALLSVGTNIRYISKTKATLNTSGSAITSTSDVETGSLFSGVVIGVVPYIHENGRIELLVHPMQTEVDPESLALIEVGTADSSSRVTLPVINYKGLTTTLNLGDGDMVLIGGLIDQSRTVTADGLPGLSEIPTLGGVFGERVKAHASRELVLALRVRML